MRSFAVDNDRQLTASALLATSLLHALVNLTSDCDQTQTLVRDSRRRGRRFCRRTANRSLLLVMQVSRPEYAIEKQLTRMLCSSMPQGVLALSADLLRNVAPALGERAGARVLLRPGEGAAHLASAVSLVPHLRALLECHEIPGVQQDKRLVASIIGALWCARAAPGVPPFGYAHAPLRAGRWRQTPPAARRCCSRTSCPSCCST